ncbi:hypothetical protein J4470_04370 [Candidatus Woesearchaeota archaeon]|nr:hypothetical protein [Candidatus Woesearchaeota archaeon]
MFYKQRYFAVITKSESLNTASVLPIESYIFYNGARFKMPQIVQVKSPVLAVVTDQTGYVKARNQAEKLSQKHGLTAADMPMAIQAMTIHPEVREAIRPGWIDTITGEYHGLRDGDRSYETWHSVGSLATAKGLEKAFSRASREDSFMQTADDEWIAIGKGNYNGQDVARIHLEDVRKGNVPAAGTPYTIFTLLDKDEANINVKGQLTYDAFMSDDRVLMVAGSPDNREALAKMLFGRKEDGGEGWSAIGSYHRIKDASFGAQNKGRLVLIDHHHFGLVGYYYDMSKGGRGRFVVVGAGGAVRATHENQGFSAPRNAGVSEETASPSVVKPTLEQAVIDSPDADWLYGQ